MAKTKNIKIAKASGIPRKTEWSIAGEIAGMMRQCRDANNIKLGEIIAEELVTGTGNPYKPDILIHCDGKPFCNIELKSAVGYTPYDPKEVANAAMKSIKLPTFYYATWNMTEFVLWSTYKNDKPMLERRVWHYKVFDVPPKSFDELKKPEHQAKLYKFIEAFERKLIELSEAGSDEERDAVSILKPIDEVFVDILRSFIDTVYAEIAKEIKEQFTADPEFKSGVTKWCRDQLWDVTFDHDDDFDKIARQYSHLFVNKILFYQCLRGKYPKIKPIKIPEKLESAERFREELNSFFDIASNKKYDTIFKANYIETLPLPKSLIPSFTSFTNEMSGFEASGIGYEIVGRVFERLIPEDERYRLGQYFTNSLLVDIIVTFCIRGLKINIPFYVLDTSTGAATFLVRAYQRMRRLNPALTHDEIMNSLYGVDISKFAVHLAMINLVILDLNSLETPPNIIHSDFFNQFPSKNLLIHDNKITTITGENKLVKIPMVDAVVANPPYTRGEEMVKAFKQKVAPIIKKETGIDLGKRAGIYAYFYMHGLVFLKEGGRLGFVTSNAWIDVEYGKYLQEYFLKFYKIIAVIEPNLERWFEDVSINTAIVILERCSDAEARKKNITKFVLLNKPLKTLIHCTDELRRYIDIDTLIDKISSTEERYTDENIRIYPVPQEKLWENGYDEDTEEFDGGTWRPYIRAPDIFYEIMDKGKTKIVPIKATSKVTSGIRSGAAKFFYLNEAKIKEHQIEEEYLDEIIKSSQECTSVIIDKSKLKYRVLSVIKNKSELEGTNVLKYIIQGERDLFHKKVTKRKNYNWYSPELRIYADILFSKNIDTTFNAIWLHDDTPIDQSYFRLCANNPRYGKVIASILNCTLSNFIVELYSHNSLGQGVLVAPKGTIKSMPIVSPYVLTVPQKNRLEEILDIMSLRDIGTIFEELGAEKIENVSFETVKPDRRELDKIIMGEVLGLTDNEQLEVYRQMIHLVRSRKEKANSVPNKKGKKRNRIEEFSNHVINGIEKLPIFPDGYLKKNILIREQTIPSGNPIHGRDLEGHYLEVDNEKIRFDSKEERDYVYYALLNGKTTIIIPQDEVLLKKLVNKYDHLFKKRQENVEKLIKGLYITDPKLKSKVEEEVQRKLLC